MAQFTRREKIRLATDRDIRHRARSLLVREGWDAVTLRAIARELGLTAPALYRYYTSREALLRQLCEEICDDLVAELNRKQEAPDAADLFGKIATVCRSFREWALAHPQEFTLVFATPPTKADVSGTPEQDQFAKVFLRVVGPLMAEGPYPVHFEQVPTELRPDIARNQEALAAAFSGEGIEVPTESLGQATVYFLLTAWVRLYGHVALEVFGRFPFDVKDAETLFESMLAYFARDMGFARE